MSGRDRPSWPVSSPSAMTLNMVVAAVVGVLIPLLLKSFRVDPAIASSVIITTFTDVFGFFSFLGLATLPDPLPALAGHMPGNFYPRAV